MLFYVRVYCPTSQRVFVWTGAPFDTWYSFFFLFFFVLAFPKTARAREPIVRDKINWFFIAVYVENAQPCFPNSPSIIIPAYSVFLLPYVLDRVPHAGRLLPIERLPDLPPGLPIPCIYTRPGTYTYMYRGLVYTYALQMFLLLTQFVCFVFVHFSRTPYRRPDWTCSRPSPWKKLTRRPEILTVWPSRRPTGAFISSEGRVGRKPRVGKTYSPRICVIPHR